MMFGRIPLKEISVPPKILHTIRLLILLKLPIFELFFKLKWKENENKFFVFTALPFESESKRHISTL